MRSPPRSEENAGVAQRDGRRVIVTISRTGITRGSDNPRERSILSPCIVGSAAIPLLLFVHFNRGKRRRACTCGAYDRWPRAVQPENSQRNTLRTLIVLDCII